MNKYFILILFALPLFAFSQDSLVQKMPQFEGGDRALLNFIVKNVRYPADARENCMMGRVYLTFLVDKAGKVDSVSSVNVVYNSLNDEAKRVINLTSGHWKPGTQNDTPVAVHYLVPIIFKLEGAGCKEAEDYYFEGNRYLNNNKLNKALENFQEAARMDPTYKDALYNCFQLSIKLNDTASACRYADKLKLLKMQNDDELIKKYCSH